MIKKKIQRDSQETPRLSRSNHFTGLVLYRVCLDVCKQWLSYICSQQKRKNTQCVYGVKGIARKSLNQTGYLLQRANKYKKCVFEPLMRGMVTMRSKDTLMTSVMLLAKR